jgi:hypothetical protein
MLQAEIFGGSLLSIEQIGGARTGSGGQHLPFCQATVVEIEVIAAKPRG